MTKKMILAVNTGSSSLRLALYSTEGERITRTRLEGDLDRARPPLRHIALSMAAGTRRVA